MKIVSLVNRLTQVLSRPVIVYWTLPWLMLLLIAGTVAQKYIGLYAAQEKFFSSFILWLGPAPLPGAYALIGLIFLSLLCKFITESRWSWPRAGIILSHFGVLLLLAGGLLTAMTAREGYIVIEEQSESSLIEDYHARILTILKDGAPIATLAASDLRAGRTLGIDQGLPFTIEIRQHMINGTPQAQNESLSADGLPLRGAATKVSMTPIQPDLQNENNHGAVSLRVRGIDTENDGLYLLTEIMPVYPQFEIKDHIYELRFVKASSTLPFTLALTDVEKENHPGADMARSYRSRLLIKDQGSTWPAEISMNNPLRYRGYTFYQSSYMQTPTGEATILSVVWNSGRLFPYIASAVISVGLILHLLLSLRSRKLIMIALGFIILSDSSAQAQDTSLHMSDFRMIPVLHEGRLKPLESFARIELHKFSGRTRLGDMDASHWLAEVLFDPAQAAERPVFIIRQRELRELLLLTKTTGDLYPFSTLTQAMAPQAERLQTLLQIPPAQLESRQKALVELHHNLSAYMQLMRSFSLVLPLAITPPNSLLLPPEKEALATQTPDYLTLRKFEERTSRRLQKIIKKKGDNPKNYNDEEKAIAAFSWQLNLLAESSRDNHLFRVMPVIGNEEERLSPWAIVQEGQGSPMSATLLQSWKVLALAWLAQDAAAWQDNARLLRTRLGSADIKHLQAESIYHVLQPFQAALLFYALAIICLLIFNTQTQTLWYRLSALCLASGTFIHLGGIALRIYILDRPPVGTLYESLLFVSLICTLAGTVLFIKRQEVLSGLATALAGLLILLISLYFGAQSGDSFSMLVAVLNTNFWLATHVLIVTAGYGLAILAAMLAHGWLYVKNDRSGLFLLMHRMALAALLFTAIGTILGGIWADQSWGRFWGWDPKENGALLIVLWIIWLLHGRMAGKLSPVFYALGISCLNMVVALAWFGVNLLSVGLHSYGFISGIAAGLAGFCLVETALLFWLWRRRRHHA